MVEVVSLQFLGPMRLLVDGAHVSVERAQTRAFLALMARTPQAPVPAQQLVDMLWPDSAPRNAPDAVRTIATRARKALRNDRLLRTVGGGYQLDLTPDAIDFLRFRQAAATATTPEEIARALDLWHGEPFDDCAKVRRLVFEAEELADRRWELSERYVASLLRSRQPDGAVAFGVPLIDERPAEDTMASLVAIGLARLGRQRDAHLLLTRTREELLSLDPGADLQLLDDTAARIATELPVFPGGRVLDRHGVDPEPAPATSPLAGHVTELVGRAAELGRLADESQAARTAGRAVVLVGEPGVGKTALAASFLESLGWRQNVVRCGEGSPEDVATLGGAPSAIGGSASASVASDAAATSARSVGAELARLAETGPLAIVVDDLQWASEVELLTLRGVVRAGLPAGVLLVMTVRPLAGLARWTVGIIADILREPTVTELALGNLSLDATRVLVRRHRPELRTRQVNRVFELTHGNAFAIRSLCAVPGFDVDQPIVDLPGAVVMVTDQRLDGLPDDTLAALQLACLLDPPIDLAAVAALQGSTVDDLAARLQPAFDRDLLVELRPGEPAFDHELTRQAIARKLAPPVRRAQHRRLADHFLADGRQPVLAGVHLLHALPDRHPDPLRVLLTAGEEALATHWYTAAIECFAGAERLVDSPATGRAIALRRGRALEHSGRRDEATELYDRLAEEAAGEGDRNGLAHAALAGLAQGVVGGDDHRLARLQRAIEDPPDDDRTHLEVVVQLAAELGYAGREIPADLAARAVELATPEPADAALLAFLEAQTLFGAPPEPRHTMIVDRLIELATAGGDVELLLRGLELRCAGLLALGDLDEARRAVGQLGARLRRTPAPRQRWARGLFGALIADLTDGLPAAEGPARAALDLGRDLELPDAVNAYAIFRLSVAVRTGGLEHLERLVDAAASGPRAVPAWRAVHAATLRAAGRADEVVAEAERFRAGYVPGLTRFADLGLALTIASTSCLDGSDDLRQWAAAALQPWSGSLIVVGAGAGCFGPSDLYLALARAERPDEVHTWAGPWLNGSWAELAKQLGALAGSR